MKTRRPRLLLLAAALLTLAAPAAHGAQKQGPRGGTSLLLEVKADAPRAAQAVGRTAAVIAKRCARLGINCELRRPAGDKANRLTLRYSTTTADAARVRRILLARGFELRALMSMFHPFPLLEYSTRAEAEADAEPVPGAEVLPLGYDDGGVSYIVAERAPVLTGDDLRSPVAFKSEENPRQYEVDCRLTPRAATRLKAWTRANINRYVALVYDGRVLSTPYIKAPIWYNVVISGGFDRQQAKDVAVVLGSGNLPAPVEVLEEGTYRR